MYLRCFLFHDFNGNRFKNQQFSGLDQYYYLVYHPSEFAHFLIILIFENNTHMCTQFIKKIKLLPDVVIAVVLVFSLEVVWCDFFFGWKYRSCEPMCLSCDSCRSFVGCFLLFGHVDTTIFSATLDNFQSYLFTLRIRDPMLNYLCTGKRVA